MYIIYIKMASCSNLLHPYWFGVCPLSVAERGLWKNLPLYLRNWLFLQFLAYFPLYGWQSYNWGCTTFPFLVNYTFYYFVPTFFISSNAFCLLYILSDITIPRAAFLWLVFAYFSFFQCLIFKMSMTLHFRLVSCHQLMVVGWLVGLASCWFLTGSFYPVNSMWPSSLGLYIHHQYVHSIFLYFSVFSSLFKIFYCLILCPSHWPCIMSHMTQPGFFVC